MCGRVVRVAASVRAGRGVVEWWSVGGCCAVESGSVMESVNRNER